MAVFPQGMSSVEARCRANPGELRTFRALKRCLEDDYLVWHDVPLGPHARQPDFVVLSPRWGILLLEVKGWKRDAFGAATKDRVELRTARGLVTEANPLRKVRDFAMELVDLMQHDAALVHADGPFRGKLLFPYGWGVVLAGLGRSEIVDEADFGAVFKPDQTLLRDDLDEDVDALTLQRRLWGMFTVHYPHTLSLPQRDRIRWHLFPEVRLDRQQGLAFDAPTGVGSDRRSSVTRLPDLLQVMDLQQEQIARSLGEGHRVIHGPAGSGKTMILIFRAEQLSLAARPDKPILVLCFNRSLAGRIDAQLRQRGIDERVVVRNFHSWCQDMVRSYQLDVHVHPDRPDDEYYAALARTVEQAVERGRVPAGQYTALLIDEAHDFEDSWLQMATRLVDPATNALLVLYDDAQSIYQKKRRKFNFASVGIEARGRTSILKLNYRNTAEVLALAMRCAQGLLDGSADADADVPTVVPTSAGRRGAMPVLITAPDERAEAVLVAERIAQDCADGVAPSQIAVLARFGKAMLPSFDRALRQRNLRTQSMADKSIRQFDWRDESIKLLSLHSAKGLEFERVYIVGLHAMPRRGDALEDELRLLYVGMTRATHALVLSAHGASAITERVRMALDAMQGDFQDSAT
jgi:UvrD-like helicase family protein/nuclease-like protein/AAA domain-containing protein